MTSQPDDTIPKTFPAAEIAALKGAGKPRELGVGEILFRVGEVGDSMYMIEQGEVELLFGDGEPGKVLDAGDLFGELAFLTGEHRRTATARVHSPCRLWEVDQDSVERLFENQPRLLLRLYQHTCRYLLASESRLIEQLRKRNRELRRTLDYLRRTQEEVDTQELLANTDELTGLYNRRCFDRQLRRFIERADQTGRGLALVLLDLDGFKPVNDTYGHPTGDTVLRRIGQVLSGCVRKSDLPCRFGGDEFSVVLVDVGPRQAQERAENIRLQIEGLPPVVSGSTLQVTASVGGTLFRPGESAAELFERADRQLYLAKNGGKNRVAWAESTHS